MRDCSCMPVRFDAGTLGEARKTPQGGLAIPAHLTRAGVFTYYRDGKAIREWRPMAEVARPATLDSLRNAPLTVRHPRGGAVTPDNYRGLSVGHVGADVKMDADKTAATVFVQDKAGLDAIANGWRDLSCGYTCDTDNTPGVVPEGEPDAGKQYDRVQRNILYNHNAIVPHGRAGTARLHLDAADNAVEEPMEIKRVETIGGIEHEVGTPAHADARKRADEAEAALKADLAKARADAAEAKGELAAAKSRLDAIDKAEAAAAAKAAREALAAKGAVVLGKDWKADGKDDAAIVGEILAKQFPDVRLDEVAEAERPAYVKGLLATIKAPPEKRADAAPAKGKHVPQPRPFPGAPVAGGNRPLAEQFRSDSMDQPCDGRGFAIQRRKPQQPGVPTMIENRS